MGITKESEEVMKTILVIPARYDSVRFPGKPLVKIRGREMILCVIDRATLVDGVDEIIVATDDDRIYDVVKDYDGIKALMTRKDHHSGMDRVAEVAMKYDKDDVILNLQGDMPFISHQICDRVLESVKNDRFAYMSTPAEMRSLTDGEIENDNAVKVAFDVNMKALYFSRKAIKGDSCWFKHIGVYCYKNWVLQDISSRIPTTLERAERLEQMRFLEYGTPIKIVPVAYDPGPDINCPADLEKIL